jgi:hypothetical protein
MKPTKYKLSFTAASLSLSESIKIAEVYLACKNWNETVKIVKDQNLLQSRTSSRTKRILRELTQRLQKLSDEQLLLLIEGNLSEQKHLLWFAICQTYLFIQEFAIEVLHEKFMSLNLEITELDYEAFFNRKADWHEELETITPLTKYKLKQVIFRILKQVELLTDDNKIVHIMLSQRLKNVLSSDAPVSYQIFPISPSDIQG